MCDYVNMFGDHLSVIIHECEIKTFVLVCVFTVKKEFFCLFVEIRERTNERRVCHKNFLQPLHCVCVSVCSSSCMCVCVIVYL